MNTPKLSTKELIKKQTDEEMQKCTEEVNKTLEKYDCFIDATVSINSRGASFQYTVLHK